MKRLLTALIFCVALASGAFAQRTGLDWMTDNSDAQRSAWIRSDGKIRKDTVKAPDFQFCGRSRSKTRQED
jgi:hypothetical protein